MTDESLFDYWHETTVRVRYAETDRMGVVYHANYLVWFEIGRTEQSGELVHDRGHQVTVLAPSSKVGDEHGIPGYVRIGRSVPVKSNGSVARIALSFHLVRRVRALLDDSDFDDELIIRTHLTELRRRSLRFGYEVIRLGDEHIIAEGETGHVVTDGAGRVRTLPDVYRAFLVGDTTDDIHTSILPHAERVPEEGAQ